MSTPFSQRQSLLAIGAVWTFLQASASRALLVSLLVLIPCFWHRRIEAGDLGSHVYNAWLAQLIAERQAPGLYIVHQWNNVLADLLLSEFGKCFGFVAAERIVVSLAVLIFFWGAFAFVAVLTDRPPWWLTPCIGMLAYGYAFNMGFLNYYLSVGFACIALALIWRGEAGNCLLALPFCALALLAHPIGFLWLLATAGYILLWRLIPEWWRLILPVLAVVALMGVHIYLAKYANYDSSWSEAPFYLRNGSDQLNIYGHRYALLAQTVTLWGIVCFALGILLSYENLEGAGKKLRLVLELYLLAFAATTLLPENLHTDLYAGWIGLIVSRLTLISAVLGICALGCLKPRKTYSAGFLAAAGAFFFFLYGDTATLNELESNAERVIAQLPRGARIVPVLNAPDDWRVEFIHHAVERACIGHCFSYSNYEPSSLQFRIRVQPGSPVVTASSPDTEAMSSGDYVVKATDPPLFAIFQCQDVNLVQLCAAPLHPGEKTEQPTLNSDN